MKVKYVVKILDSVYKSHHVDYLIADDENLYFYYSKEDKIIINRMCCSSYVRYWHPDLYRVFTHYHPNCDILDYKIWPDKEPVFKKYDGK